MYLSAVPTRRQSLAGRRGRPTLGDWSSVSKTLDVLNYPTTAVWNAMQYYYDLATGQPVSVPPPAAPAAPGSAPTPPADSGTSLFIPNSSVSDILMNAITGKPTAAQIYTNTGSPYQDCVNAIQHMRQISPSTVPAGAEAKCSTDLNAYVKLIGGTAEQQAPTTLWAWAILLGVVGGVYLVTQ